MASAKPINLRFKPVPGATPRGGQKEEEEEPHSRERILVDNYGDPTMSACHKFLFRKTLYNYNFKKEKTKLRKVDPSHPSPEINIGLHWIRLYDENHIKHSR